MNDVNELWSSAWLTMQKNLARGFGMEWVGESLSMRESEVQGRAATTGSWLVRARSRKMQASKVIIQ